MMKIAVGDLSFSAEVAGQGPPLLLVHGFPLSRRMWREQIPVLAETHRVIAADLRGFGESSPAPAVMTMDAYANDLAGMLDALGVTEPVTFCGLSMGGYIAFSFARHHRHRLGRLILCDTRAAADSPAKAAERERTAENVLKHGVASLATGMPGSLLGLRSMLTRPLVAAALGKMILDAPPGSVAAALRGMAARPDSTDLLPALDVPTLVLCGEEDGITPPDEMRSVAAALPDAAFALIPAAGHLSPMENPEAVNQAMREFLSPEAPPGAGTT